MEQDNFATPQHHQQEIKPLKWTLYLFVASIPLVGIIMLLVWAFGNDSNRIRSNWAKGALIYALIVLVLYFVIALIFGAAFAAAMSSGNYESY
ncbi:MAG: hypothetical protein WBG46_13870 [Nonlabens sp.]